MSQIAKIKVPTLQELMREDLGIERENEFQVLLNQEPPKEWVKVNEMANGSRYLPIDKVEYVLTRLFVKWWVEVLDYKIIANSCAVHIRLFYISPITGETMHQDGLGASPMQTDKGSGATDFNHIKNAAVQMALPSAETYAIKDAAEKIGRLFGKDLNRKDLMNYTTLSGRFSPRATDKDLKEIGESLEDLHDHDEVTRFWNQLDKEIQEDNRVINLFTQKSIKLNGNPGAARSRAK